MKRPSIPKRRNRRTGLSPYQRHGKREFLYSGELRNWEAQFKSKEQVASQRVRTVAA